MWLLVISCKGLTFVVWTLWEIRSCLVVDACRYLCILERVSVISLSFPAVCSIVQSTVIKKSCHLLSFGLPGVCCIKVSRGLWSLRSINLCSLNGAFKTYRLLIIANNSVWKVGYLSCAGLYFLLWTQDGLIVLKIPCPIHNPSSTSLASHIRYFGSLDLLFQSFKIC